MTPQEEQGLAILGALVLIVSLFSWAVHSWQEVRYYRRVRQKAEQQHRDIMQAIKEGRL